MKENSEHISTGLLTDKVARRLVLAYRVYPDYVARTLDERIDKSGMLLGWLRELSMELPEDLSDNSD
jgi:hypothetical protein